MDPGLAGVTACEEAVECPGSSLGMTTERLLGVGGTSGSVMPPKCRYRGSIIPASFSIWSTTTVCPVAMDWLAAMPVRMDQAPSRQVEARP